MKTLGSNSLVTALEVHWW